MASFDTAVNITLSPAHEGGFQKNPNDKGNWTGGQIGSGTLKGTNMGISAAQFPNLDIEHLTVDQAKNIYYTAPQHYWGTFYGSITDQNIANKLFDLGVLFGPPTAIKVLQEVLMSQHGIVPDGVFGSQTLGAVNISEPASLLAAYKVAMVSKAVQGGANNPAERADVPDWIRRINS